MSVDQIQEAECWPVNELGEIVVQSGAGTTNIVGCLPSGFVPTDITTKKMVVKMPSDVAKYATDASGNVTGLVGPGGVAGYVDAGLLGAAPSASATANTAAIQAALDITGRVSLITPGTYLVNASLVIKSNTHFIIGAGVIIKQATGATNNVIVNYAATLTRLTVSSLTSSGLTVTATTSAAHGYAVGQWVAIHGSGTSGYNGCYLVTGVSSPTVFTYAADILPGATTAAISAQQTVISTVPADTNIFIEGGAVDYNVANFAASSGQFFGNVIFLAHLVSYGIGQMFLNNAGTRCVWVSNARHGVVTKVRTDTTRVCIQTNGAIHGLKIDNIESTGTDDGIAIMAKEQNAYTLVTYSEGDVIGVTVDRARLSHATSGVAVYNGGGGTHLMSGVKVSNISGNNGNAVQVLGSSGQLMTANDITIDGISGVSANYSVLIQYATVGDIRIANVDNRSGNSSVAVANATVELLTVDGLKYRPLVATQPQSPISTGTGAVVQRLVANRVLTDTTWTPSSGTYVCAFTTTAPAHWSLSNSHINSGVNVIAVAMGAAGVTGTLDNVLAEGASRIFYSSAAGTLDLLTVKNSRVIGSANSFSVGSSMSIHFNGYTTSGGTNALQISAGTVTLSGGGFNFNGMIPLATSGTPTVYVKSLEFPVDIGATGITKLAGLLAYNTGTGRGTVAQNRHVTCNGTNWVQIDTPANVY